MPMYEYLCECGYEFEAIVPVDRRDDVACECGLETKRLMSKANLIGAMFDKKITIPGLDQTFETNKQLRDWEAANPDSHIVSTKSAEWKQHVYEANTVANNNAKKWGFKDHADFSRVQKREHAKGGDAFS